MGQALISLSSKDGAELKYGVVFEVIAVPKKPSAVTDGGKALSEVKDAAALTAASSGWTHVPDAGGTVLVKVGPGAHAVTITLP